MAGKTIRVRLIRNVAGWDLPLSHGTVGVLESIDTEGGARVRFKERRITVRLSDLEVWSEEGLSWGPPTERAVAAVRVERPPATAQATPIVAASPRHSGDEGSPRVRLNLDYTDPQGVLQAGQLVKVDKITGPQSARLRVGDRRVAVRTAQLEVWSERLGDWRPLSHDPGFAAAIEETQKRGSAGTGPAAPRPFPVPARATSRHASSPTSPRSSTPSAPARAPWVVMIVVGIVVAIFAFTYIPSAPSGGGVDLDCADVGHKVRVGSADPNGLDRDGDGIGCEANGNQFAILGWIALGAIALGAVQLVRNQN